GCEETIKWSRPVSDLPAKAALARVIRKAAALNEQGIKNERGAAAAKKPLRVPAELAAGLKKSARAKAAFDAVSPSNRRKSIEWTGDAKRPETKARRVATAIDWMAAGKHRHWKYER